MQIDQVSGSQNTLSSHGVQSTETSQGGYEASRAEPSASATQAFKNHSVDGSNAADRNTGPSVRPTTDGQFELSSQGRTSTLTTESLNHFWNEYKNSEQYLIDKDGANSRDLPRPSFFNNDVLLNASMRNNFINYVINQTTH